MGSGTPLRVHHESDLIHLSRLCFTSCVIFFFVNVVYIAANLNLGVFGPELICQIFS